MFDKKYGVPEEQARYLQMLFDRLNLTAKQKHRVLETYCSIASWDEPVMPVVINSIAASFKGETVADVVQQGIDDISASTATFIATVEARNEFIQTESQAVDQALKQANEEFSRKLAKLNDRVEASIETIAKTQSQLIQMHTQLATRSRQNLRGKLTTYCVTSGIGFLVGMLLHTLLS